VDKVILSFKPFLANHVYDDSHRSQSKIRGFIKKSEIDLKGYPYNFV